jgi:hypothetical protein
MAPNLYNIAKFKNKYVHYELSNRNWIKNLQGVSTISQLEELNNLFMAPSSTSLNDQDDEIRWIWTTDGKFTVSSAYDYQFLGALTFFNAADIWKAYTEQKCKSFGWLIMHNRVLTADNMSKKIWPCNPLCSLCFCMEETGSHLLT